MVMRKRRGIGKMENKKYGALPQAPQAFYKKLDQKFLNKKHLRVFDQTFCKKFAGSVGTESLPLRSNPSMSGVSPPTPPQAFYKKLDQKFLNKKIKVIVQ